MKPRIFIGSSVESLEIAGNIQELLQHESNTTIWTQGIFDLSNTALQDLIKALENFDFAIFVFNPDDISNIRGEDHSVVRDNLIFELGLFIGKLGNENVFFVTPFNTKNFHLPSDLAGINYGKYDSDRDDKNLLAALGPFCNQVKRKLKKFIIVDLGDLQNENQEIKDIFIKKSEAWEFELTSALIKDRLVEINQYYNDLEKNIYFSKTKTLKLEEYLSFNMDKFDEYTKLLAIFTKLYTVELYSAFGEPGQPGDAFQIKSVVDKMKNLCKNLFQWEIEIISIKPPDFMQKVPEYMKGWSKVIIDKINTLPELIDSQISVEALLKNNNRIDLHISFDELPNSSKLNELMKQLTEEIEAGRHL